VILEDDPTLGPTRWEWEQATGRYPALVAFPLKSEWLTLHPEAAETFPEPLRASDSPDPLPEVPGPVLKLQRLAEGAGWATLATYAVGHHPHATHGRPSATAKPSWALRMRRGDQRAVAVRVGSAWASFWYWTPEVFFMRAGTLAEFEGWIKA
jgi:hypothetical protein